LSAVTREVTKERGERACWGIADGASKSGREDAKNFANENQPSNKVKG